MTTYPVVQHESISCVPPPRWKCRHPRPPPLKWKLQNRHCSYEKILDVHWKTWITTTTRNHPLYNGIVSVLKITLLYVASVITIFLVRSRNKPKQKQNWNRYPSPPRQCNTCTPRGIPLAQILTKFCAVEVFLIFSRSVLWSQFSK